MRFARSLVLMCLLAPAWAGYAHGQRGDAIGLRFASDFNSFFRARQRPLINGTFSTAILGAFYKNYYANGLVELGANICHKEKPGGFALPLIMEDLQDGQATAVTALEADFKVGPRILKYFYPRFGVILGYWLRREGFLEPGHDDLTLNRWYAALPVGFSLDFPTSFGTVGAGAYFDIGLTNVVKTDDPDSGGKLRALNFELHVALGALQGRR